MVTARLKQLPKSVPVVLQHLQTTAGFHFPDYEGGSIVNLLSSIIHASGGQSPHLRLKIADPRPFEGVSRIVYLVLDGVGYNQLGRFMAAGGGGRFFSRHPRERITTVFPSTTAAAVTTLATGATPAEHGILSWHLYLPDLGLVGAVLPGRTLTGTRMTGSGFNLRRYLGLPSYLSPVRRHKRLLSFGSLGESAYSNAGTRWNGHAAYKTLAGMARQILRFGRGGGRGVAYAYWPLYDTLCHNKGVQARETGLHLAAIDQSLERIADGLAGSGTLLLVTADHGVVDAPAPPASRVDRRSPGFSTASPCFPPAMPGRCPASSVRDRWSASTKWWAGNWRKRACASPERSCWQAGSSVRGARTRRCEAGSATTYCWLGTTTRFR